MVSAMLHRTLSMCGAAIVLSVCGALLGPVGAHAQTKVVEGYVSDGALQWPEYVAIEKGWFKENGIDLEMLAVGGGAAQQLAAGALNIGYSGFPDFIRATNQGAPIKIIMNGVNTPPFDVYAKPTIKTIADLKGKVVSIGGNKDVTLIYITAMLSSAGLQPKDLDFLYAKATPARLSALVSGGVDAAILYPPTNFNAASAGYNKIADISHFIKDFPFTVYATNTEWAKSHAEALRGYMKAYGRAVAWLYDQKNKQEAVALLIKYGKYKPDDASRTYDYFMGIKAYSADGLISDGGYKQMTDALIGFGDLTAPPPPMTAFVDDSYVKAGWGK